MNISPLPLSVEGLRFAALAYSAFILLLFLVSRFVPGLERQGQTLASGERLDYKLSGLLLFLLVNGSAALFLLSGGSLAPLIEHFWAFLVVVNVWAFAITAYLMSAGWSKGAGLRSSQGFVGALKDIWLGAELNPRLLGVDLKMFMYHPSLIGLQVMNLAFASYQLERYGTVSPEMVLYQSFTSAYLFTHYIREDFMLSTWDIIAERFGFMLVWGDLVYVTFFYSLVGWFVVDYGWRAEDGGFVHEGMGSVALAALVIAHVAFHTVFRSSNWQKDRFKRDPKAPIWGRVPETIGGRLLVSGWWGVGRKINYTGEIGVYFTFAFCAGFSSWVPYVLPLSLVVLLTQRAWRDEQRCSAKYGELWRAYCERARFRIFPFLY